MLEITPQLQSLLFYIFGMVGALGIYIFKDFKQSTDEKFKSIVKKIEEDRNQSNNYDKQLLNLTNTINRFVDNLGKLEEKFEKFMEKRQEYHTYIEKISANLMTEAQMMDVINKLDSINKKMHERDFD